MDKILLAVNTLGMWKETNGVATTYRHILPLFKKRGIEVDVLTYGPEDYFCETKSIRTYTHKPRLPLKIDPSLWVDMAFSKSELSKEIAKHKYSLVHSATPCPMGSFAGKVAKKQEIPFVNTYHTTIDSYVESRVAKALGTTMGCLAKKIIGKQLKKFYDNSDLILAPSQTIREELQKIFSAPVDVFGRGIDTAKFNNAYRNRDDIRPRAIYVGRVAPEKNLDTLVEIFAGDELNDTELTIVGDGPSLNEMKRALPSARYTGKKTGTELAEEYANADFFVFPSCTDTFGNVILEAYASGLPVIVTDKRAPKELVNDGKTGLICSNKAEFSNAVKLLSRNDYLRQTMSMAAIEHSQGYTWDKAFETLLQKYHDAKTLRRI